MTCLASKVVLTVAAGASYAPAECQFVRPGECRRDVAGGRRGAVGGVVCEFVDSSLRRMRMRMFACGVGCLASRAGSRGCARFEASGSAMRLGRVHREVERGRRRKFVRLMLEASSLSRLLLVM
jgi:hypothetical protein